MPLDTLRASRTQSADAHSALADVRDKRDRGRGLALREIEAAAALTPTLLAGKAALYYRLADLEHRHLEYRARDR